MDYLVMILMLCFYFTMSCIGFWIVRRKFGSTNITLNEMMIAGSSLGPIVGVLTLCATEVGAVFINGTAEEVFNNGIFWCLVPVCYSISMTLNALFFVDKLRNKGYITLIDVLQDVYGNSLGGIVYIPSCIGDVCWNAALLTALGTMFSVILDFQYLTTVIISAATAVCYTVIGGIYSVAYTDVVQFLLIILGLLIATPTALFSPVVKLNDINVFDWFGVVNGSNWVTYADTAIMILCGGIPWQSYYQRIFSFKSSKQAKIVSFTSTILCIMCAVPPIIIGGLAREIKWSESETEELVSKSSLVLPLVLQKLAPNWITYIGIITISAAGLSSLDSSLLSGASYLTHNIFNQTLKKCFRQFHSNAFTSETVAVAVDVTENRLKYKPKTNLALEQGPSPPPQPSSIKNVNDVTFFRFMVVLLGVVSFLMTLSSATILELWVIAGEIGFIVVFPQFLCAVQCPTYVDSAGCVSGAVAAILLRILIGIEIFSIPPLINVPLAADDVSPLLPVKTLIMLVSLTTLLLASFINRKIKCNS